MNFENTQVNEEDSSPGQAFNKFMSTINTNFQKLFLTSRPTDNKKKLMSFDKEIKKLLQEKDWVSKVLLKTTAQAR